MTKINIKVTLQTPLLGLHGIVFRTPARVRVGPIHCTVHKREKVLLHCASADIYDTLLEVLAGTLAPLEGRLVEHETVRLQTDRHLRDAIHPNRSIRELNASSKLPESIWLGARRRSLFGVMDKLGISTHVVHRPLKMEPQAVFEKYWALRFVASEAELLVGREIFALEDPAIREVIALRWNDVRGALIYAGPPERIPSPPDTVLRLNDDGSVSVEEGEGRRVDRNADESAEQVSDDGSSKAPDPPGS